MNLKHFFAFLLLLLMLSAQAGTGYVFLADTSKLFYASNNEIYSPDGKQLLFFQKGNIFFSGTNDDKQNIYLMATSMNYASTRVEVVYERDSRTAGYSFSNGKFYAGNVESEDLRQKAELIHVERVKKWLSFYSSHNDSLLAYFNADSLPNSTAVLVAYTLIKKYNLEKQLQVKQNELPFEDVSYSTIKPVWGNATANEWMWDGKILRPRWNVDPRLAWEFDGKIIKPHYGNNIYQQYEWDGETLKPVWRNNRPEEWSYDGRVLKPIYDTDWANQYIIENGIVKPWSNVHTEKEWRMDGQIPIPLVILIVSGIARAY
ncbi:MAG TPA: hypothetical protein PLW44_00615 [Chitinophagales bacterium]|nr:hypothetical protein [Chitinophagales bacterium]